MWRRVVVGLLLVLGVLIAFADVKQVYAQCTDAMVECGDWIDECVEPRPGGGCDKYKTVCGGGNAYQQAVSCSVVNGSCRANTDVCSSVGKCTVAIYGCGFTGGGSTACTASSPACDGSGCASNQYCAARVSDPKQCICKERTGDGCYGGWVWVGPGGTIRRCCVVNAPVPPTLVSHPNGAQLASGQVNLSWSSSVDWV